MIIAASIALFLALVIALAMLSGDYSFDGICRLMFYGYSSSLLVLGDLLYGLLLYNLLTIFDYRLTQADVVTIGLCLVLLRYVFAITFERYYVATNPAYLLRSGVGLMALVILAENLEITWLTITISTLVVGLSWQYVLENPYDDSFLVRIVGKHMEKYSQELAFIDTRVKPMAKRKAMRSILLTEVINRPRAWRILENALQPLGIVKTAGIMQTPGKHDSTDEEILAASKFLNSSKHKTLEGYAQHYNGKEYAKFVSSVDKLLES